MPDQKFTSWVHGSSMQIEYPARITSVRHCGPFVRIEGGRGQNTWVHFPIPTPAVINGANMKVDSAMLSFRTRSNAVVNEIIVYDGEKRIAEHMDLNLRDDHLDARFDVPGSPEVNQGINIVKRHTKANPNMGVAGGIVEKEAPIERSNVAIYNSATQKADRVGFKFLEDGTKVRFFKSNQEVIDG